MKEQTLTLRIDWSDLDLLGHVNNVAIIRYFQSARVVFSEAAGLTVFPGMETGPIEAATEVRFLKQLRFPGTIVVHTSVAEIGTTSFVLDHRIVDEAGDLAAHGREVIVCFDFVRQVKMPIPPRIREKLLPFLPSDADGANV